MDALKRVHSFKCTGLIRRVLLSWLLAVTMEFLLLPEKLRNLEGLEGMAQMSLLRVAAITLCGTVFLAGVSRLVNSARAERWGFAVLFTLLAAAALRKRASAGTKERGWNEKHFRRYQNAEF